MMSEFMSNNELTFIFLCIFTKKYVLFSINL